MTRSVWFVRLTAALIAACPVSGLTSTCGVELQMTPLGYYRHGSIGSAEIVAHEPQTQRLFVVNGESHALDVLDISDPRSPRLYERIRVDRGLAEPTHVHVHNGLVAVALAAADKQSPGQVVFLDVEGNERARVEVGFLPDMLTFTPDGGSVVVACEGEPSPDYQRDPEGSIAVIDLTQGLRELGPKHVTRIGFERFYDRALLPEGVRILKGTYVPQDLEPEYLTVSPDGDRAWVVLQENNAIAMVDLRQREITQLFGLGYKDHSQPENSLDANSTDAKAELRTWPILGMYQPDAIASFDHHGSVFLVTANEGDSRGYEAFNEEVLVRDLKLDEEAFPEADKLQSAEELGNLHCTSATGDHDGDGDHDAIYTFGGRSFSIWSEDGKLVFDSGNQIEQRTAELLGGGFNSDQSPEGGFDQRSDDRGPEPECLDVGEVSGRRFAFIGLERTGGIMAFDITEPWAPSYAGYVNTLKVSGTGPDQQLTDSSPEGIRFIPTPDSPTGRALLAVAFEVSGTTRIYELGLRPVAEPRRIASGPR